MKVNNFNRQLANVEASSTGGAAGGDLGGSFPSPTVDGIDGYPISGDPTAGDTIIFDGTNWVYVSGPSTTGAVFAVAPENGQARRYLMRDGSWRSPFIQGTGALAVGAITTITDDSKYNAWPNVARTNSGTLILAYTKGDSHHSDNTGIAVCKIGTEGLNGVISWGSEITIYDHPTLWVTPMGIGRIASGRLFATLWRDNYASAGTGEAGIVYSDDGGTTWTNWIDLTNGFTQEAYGAGPVVQLSNGDLLVTIEGSNSGQAIANRSSHTLRSTNGGLTWGSEVTVRNYVTDTRPYYESKLVLLSNDTLLCVHRTSNLAGTHYLSTSTDGGLTWGAPVAIVTGYGAPSTRLMSTGTLVLITRQNSDAATIAYTSIDSGTTWSSAVVLDATMYEMEYGCPIELLDGRVLVVYGSQPTSSLTNSDIKQIYLSEATDTGAGSPLTTKGDLYTFSTENTRLPVGANGQAIVADSTQATGLRWATAVGLFGLLVEDGATDPPVTLYAEDGADWLYADG